MQLASISIQTRHYIRDGNVHQHPLVSVLYERDTTIVILSIHNLVTTTVKLVLCLRFDNDVRIVLHAREVLRVINIVYTSQTCNEFVLVPTTAIMTILPCPA